MTESTVKILVVDDEELLRNSMAKFLERKGFTVEVAESANTAFAVLERRSFDLVLSDVRMPDGDGPFLLSLIRQKAGEDKPSVMFMTGYSDLGVEELMGLGAVQVFNKPVDRQDILIKIKEHFQID